MFFRERSTVTVLFSQSKKKCGDFGFVFKEISKFTYVLFSQSKKKYGGLVSVSKEMWCFRFASKRNVVVSSFFEKKCGVLSFL